MEGAVNSRDGSHLKQGEERLSDNESDEEDPEPPSPIQVGSERALTPDVDFPDPQELRKMDAETQSRLKAFLEVAGVKLSHVDARTFQDPEILRKLTNRCVRYGVEWFLYCLLPSFREGERYNTPRS